MDDAEVAKLADVVSTRVFEAMSKFVDVLQGLVRENEELRSKVEYLEIALFGPEPDLNDDYDVEDDGFDDIDDGASDAACDCWVCVTRRARGPIESAWEPARKPEDDDKPTFD